MANYNGFDGNVGNEMKPSFEVRVIGGAKGKGLFALKKFKEGEVIFEEKPLVCCQFLWNGSCGYQACDYCMRSMETAEENARRLSAKQDLSLPYSQCCATDKEAHVECAYCEVSYCSEACRKLAWEQYHQTLCSGAYSKDPSHPLEQLQEKWRHMHYPPETANIMLIARMIATVKQAKDQAGAIHLFSQFCHKTINEDEEMAHKLLGEQFQVQLETLRMLIIKALYEESVQHWFTPQGFRSLLALIGTNGQGVGTSPLSVWVKNCDAMELPKDERESIDPFIDQLYVDIEKESGGFLNNEGSALYPLQSSCNHSCIPNAEPSFPDNNFNLVMVAIQDISEGQEICVSYLDECNRNRSRHSRIKILRENYLFTCACPKCQEQVADPDVTSDDDDDDDDEDDDGADVNGQSEANGIKMEV